MGALAAGLQKVGRAYDYPGNPAGVTPSPGYTWGGKGNLPVPVMPAALTATAGQAASGSTVLTGPLGAASTGAAGTGKTLTGS